MKTILRQRTVGDDKIKIEISQNFNISGLGESEQYMKLENASGWKKEMLLEGVKIVAAEIQLSDRIQFDVTHTFPLYKIQFELEGYSSYTPKNDNSIPVLIESGEYNFFYLPKVDGILSYRQNRKVVEIIFTEDYLMKLFNDDMYKVSRDLAKAIEDKKPFIMFQKSKRIPHRIRNILYDIVNCRFQNNIKQVFLQSKVSEILSILFSDMSSEQEASELRDRSFSKIYEAKKILTDDLKNVPTIAELSKKVGINQQKLKTSFKQVYKEPIFRYVTKVRMERAQELLLHSDMTISEISYDVGYKNPQHFTAAFKRKFNTLPSAYRNN